MEDDLIFIHDSNKMWIATTDKGKVSVNVLADVVKIFHSREEKFEDLHEALSYLKALTGQRPMFTMDASTANTRTKL